MPDTLLPKHINISTKCLVIYYHGLLPKFKYKEMCSIITFHHSRSLTISRIKSVCKANELNRKINVSDDHLCRMIENELNTSLSFVEYRQTTENLCLKYGVNVVMEDVHKALKSVGPDGVNKRKSKTIIRREFLSSRPGSIYHIVVNDKLKCWGFGIHGWVYSFSRKVHWLVVASSNNDPAVISNYSSRIIRKYGIAPNLLRMG